MLCKSMLKVGKHITDIYAVKELYLADGSFLAVKPQYKYQNLAWTALSDYGLAVTGESVLFRINVR